MRQSLFGRSIVGRAMEILLVEDDLADARAALQVLDRGHVRCRVSLVRDGDEAIRFIRRQGVFAKAPRPDLIMLEVSVPKHATAVRYSPSCVPTRIFSESQWW